MQDKVTKLLIGTNNQKRMKSLRCDSSRQATALVLANPHSAHLTLGSAMERVEALLDEGVALFPWTYEMLKEVGSLLERFTTLTLKQLLQLLDVSWLPTERAFTAAAAKPKAVSEELVEYLPVLAVHVYHGQRPRDHPAQIHFLWVPDIDGHALPYLLSLLAQGHGQYLSESHNADLDIVVEDDLGGNEGCDTNTRSAVGRKRLEEKPEYGEAFLNLIINFVRSRGQMATDVQRLKGHGEVFGCPLSAIVAEARKHGYPCSASAIWNLMQPRARNSVSSAQRGVLPIRVARAIKGEKKWHPRDAFSVVVGKLNKQLLTLLKTQGTSVLQLGVDGMKKTPIWISATSGRAPRGFLVDRKDGRAVFSVADHDFPIEAMMLMTTSGVHILRTQVHVGAPIDSEKPQLLIAEEGEMVCYIRAHRYNPTSALTNFSDLARTIENSEEARNTDVLLTTSDNGPDYSCDSQKVTALYARIWMDFKMCMAIMNAHAPYHSSWHSEVEPQWRHANRANIGQHYGRTAVKGDDPFAEFEDRESACRAISTAAVKEYCEILANNCRTGGKPWRIEAPKNDEQSYWPDSEVFMEFLNETSKVSLQNEKFAEFHKESAIVAKHMTKLPSMVILRMCVEDQDIQSCSHCSAVLREKRAADPSWHPKKVLAPLAKNNYMPYLPSLPEDSWEALDLPLGRSLVASVVPYDQPEHLQPVRRNPYRSFLDLCTMETPQTQVAVPVSVVAKRPEAVIPCKTIGCRYFAKYHGEMTRHEMHCHNVAPPVREELTPALVEPDRVKPAETFTLDGALPAMPTRKRKRKRESAKDDEKEEEDDYDHLEEDSDDHEPEDWEAFRGGVPFGSAAASSSDGVAAAAAAVAEIPSPPPVPADGPRTKPGERVVWRYKNMFISEVLVKGELAGFGATCGRHNDVGDKAGTTCKKVCTFGEAQLSKENCILYLKRWLLKGKTINVDGNSSRTDHIKKINRTHMAKGPGLDLIDAELAINFP